MKKSSCFHISLMFTVLGHFYFFFQSNLFAISQICAGIFVVKADRTPGYNHIIKIEARLFQRKIGSCNLKLAKHFSKRNKKMCSKQ